MGLVGITVCRPKGMRCARSLRWTGVPRARGACEVATVSGRLGRRPQSSRARAASDTIALRRERVRLREELDARRVIQEQLRARARRADRRLAMTHDQSGVQP